jgi:hypothetical protein
MCNRFIYQNSWLLAKDATITFKKDLKNVPTENIFVTSNSLQIVFVTVSKTLTLSMPNYLKLAVVAYDSEL